MTTQKEVEQITNDTDRPSLWHICCMRPNSCGHTHALCGWKFADGREIKAPAPTGDDPDDCVVCDELWDRGMCL